jgi:ABC-2 type transport system ATP-binding protein
MEAIRQRVDTAEYTAETLRSAKNAVVALERVSKRYGQTVAVKDVSFEVYAGDVFGLLGANGSGKTTLMRILTGLVRADSGHIQIFGQSVHPNSTALERVAAVLEAPTFYPKLSGYANLRVVASLVGLSDAGRVQQVLNQVGLTDRAQDRFETYSLGMKQRLCIAGALLRLPELIILDEPTNGLDPVGMREIRQLITQLAQQGHTVLLCSHLLHEVQQVCNRVTILNRGEVIASGVVNDLLNRQGSLQVRVASGDLHQAMQVLTNNGLVWSQPSHEPVLTIQSSTMQSPVDASTVNQLLATHGIYAVGIEDKGYSLEEYFLTLMDRSGR